MPLMWHLLLLLNDSISFHITLRIVLQGNLTIEIRIITYHLLIHDLRCLVIEIRLSHVNSSINALIDCRLPEPVLFSVVQTSDRLTKVMMHNG
jgi:hypothetical protein